jgi:hypothetical protein
LSFEFGTFHVKVLLVKTLDAGKAADIWGQSHWKVFYAVSSPSLMSIENSSCTFFAMWNMIWSRMVPYVDNATCMTISI